MPIDVMPFRHDVSTWREAEYRQVFRNRYVVGFSAGVLLSLIFGLICGLVFSAVLLLVVGYFALGMLYAVFGLDPLGMKSELTAGQPITSRWIIEGVIAFLVWLAFFAYLGPHSLVRLKRRLSARLYVLAGRPLASVEGRPTFDPSSESGYNGIGVGEFYFDFEDCWLGVEGGDLEKWERAGGVMRVWYIPTGMRSWNNPRTGRLVKYNCIPVRAEWRASG